MWILSIYKLKEGNCQVLSSPGLLSHSRRWSDIDSTQQSKRSEKSLFKKFKETLRFCYPKVCKTPLISEMTAKIHRLHWEESKQLWMWKLTKRKAKENKIWILLTNQSQNCNHKMLERRNKTFWRSRSSFRTILRSLKRLERIKQKSRHRRQRDTSRFKIN